MRWWPAPEIGWRYKGRRRTLYKTLHAAQLPLIDAAQNSPRTFHHPIQRTDHDH
jgi:hypothetical protein